MIFLFVVILGYIIEWLLLVCSLVFLMSYGVGSRVGVAFKAVFKVSVSVCNCVMDELWVLVAKSMYVVKYSV